MTRGGQPDPARSHCPFLVLTPGISAQFLEADPDRSRANTGRFAGVFGMTCEPEQPLAMQKVVGSNPISRFGEGLHLQAFFGSGSRQVRLRRVGPKPDSRPGRSSLVERKTPSLPADCVPSASPPKIE